MANQDEHTLKMSLGVLLYRITAKYNHLKTLLLNKHMS
ncbi:hypothetical protein C8N37_106254 [Sphingobacterium faecium]|jgi:hypothetical protein|nr:hypothetical protein C8N37_106254 [Sphingobacterium faecium]